MVSMYSIAGRIRRQWKQKGLAATVRFVLSRMFRHQRHLVYDITFTGPLARTNWPADEQVLQVGPENIDAMLSPQLLDFLGGDEAYESVQGIRNGDRLFVITSGAEYLHRGYILFNTRQKKILGEAADTPLIANCRTAPAARGRGLYRRALNEELCYAQALGYQRVIIETDPENIASRKGIEAAGFVLRWEARVWIAFNLLLWRCIITDSARKWEMAVV